MGLAPRISRYFDLWTQSSGHTGIRWPWVAGLTFLWFASTTWIYPLLLPDEGRYVGVAWHMLTRGDFLTPRLDGLPFFHKPPLFYWLTSGALGLFGANVWAARLVSVISAVIVVTAIYCFTRRYANLSAASRIALILALQPFFFGAAHYANMDMLVAMLMSLTILAGADAVFRHEQSRPDRAVLVGMYAAAAAGFLAKGLIGVVLPGAVLFFWLLGRRRFAAMGRLLWWPGIVLFLALCLPWLLLVERSHPGFLDYFFIRQQFQRFLETGFNNVRPFWFYVPVVLGLTLPWSVQLLRWITRHGPRRADFIQSRHSEPIDRGVLRGLMLSWLLVILVFFSIPSSKLIGYVIIALPPLAWFIQETFEARAQGGTDIKRDMTRHGIVAAAVCLAVVVAVLIFPPRSTRALAHTLSRAAQPGDALVMLDRYFYDVPFYSNWDQPIIVVSNWNDPRILRSDSWRRELYDSAQFASARGASVLWMPQRLKEALCAPDHPTFWLIGGLSAPMGFPEIATLKPVKETRREALWRIPQGSVPGDCTGK